MSYFDPTLTQRLKDALADLGVQTNDYPSLVRIYYTIHVLRKHLQGSPELTPVMFNTMLNSDRLLMALSAVDVRPFSLAQGNRLYSVYNLISENDLDRDYVRFFRLLAPALVADWARFSPNMKGGSNWEGMLLVLYHICLCIYRVSGTKAVFDLNPSKVAEDILNAELLEDYSAELLDKCVRHALYIELDPLDRKLKGEYTRKLRDVIDKIAARCDKYGNITAHDCILQFLAEGKLTSDAALNHALKRLQKVPPSDVICQLQPRAQQDDILALRFVLMRFWEVASEGEMLIYNPAPTMLREYQYIGGELTDTIFVVPDALEAQAYQQQFSAYRICSVDTLPEKHQRNILVFDDDGSIEHEQVRLLLKKCVYEKSQLLIYTPQTEVMSISQSMEKSGLYIDAILGLPTGISQSKPAKKALIFGSVDCCDVVRIMQMERNIQKGRGKTGLPYLPVNALYLSRQYVEIPRQRFQPKLTITQMINMKLDAGVGNHAKYHQAQRFVWSQEITIFYSIYTRKNGNFEGRAHLKSVSRLNGEIRYGKMIGTLQSRGLRGKTEDEILNKLPPILFEQDLYNEYVPVLEQLYDDSPDGLTLKTVWYMLWGDLQLKTSYNDSVCHELFCGECQALSNIKPMTATPESIMKELEKVCGVRRITEEYLKQLCLIYNVAVEREFFAENKLKDVIARVRTQNSDMENVISRLRKRTVTDDEIMRILAVLMEKDGEFPRYASSSENFFMIMTLFAAVSLVHLRALTWADIVLTPKLCVINISKKITRDDRVIAIESPFVVPGSPIITMICQDRLHYLVSQCGISVQMLDNEPLFWACDPNSVSALKKGSREPISHATAKRLQHEMITIANIQAEFTRVTDGDHSQVVNLNDINLRTFWCDNVATQAAIRGLDRGEVSALLGKTPIDTVDAHYYGFDAPYNLMRMAAILHRWTAPYEALLRPTFEEPWRKEFYEVLNADLRSCCDAGKRSSLFFEICSKEREGDVRIEIDSQNGHSAIITQIG